MNEIQYGDLSAVLMQNTPFWGQWLRTPELSIALLDEWEDKIEKLAQHYSGGKCNFHWQAFQPGPCCC